MKEWWKDYFSFTKKERTGALVLIVMIIALFVAPHFFQEKDSEVDEEGLNWNKLSAIAIAANADSLNGKLHDQNRIRDNFNKIEAPAPIKLFKFDPNTLSSDGWQKLGVSEKVAQTIQNYIKKGGKFRSPEDLRRIYGLKSDQVERLILYAEIKNAEQEKRYPTKKSTYRNGYAQSGSAAFKPFSKMSVDINIADTSAWIALPGIGSKLATRIVNFREKLGGFYSIEQVSETFGLADSVFQKIKSQLQLSDLNIRKIDINKAPVNELKLHPYIQWNIAQAIVRYREQHGLFSTIDQLSGIHVINKEWLEKIKPYLVVN